MDRDEWPKLQPLETKTVLPDFPVWALPEDARNYAEAAAASASVPVDMMAMLIITGVSAAIQGYVTVRLYQDHAVPTNLYVMVILPPGERKSSAVSLTIWPYLDYEAQAAQVMDEAVTEYNVRRVVLEKAARAAEERAGKDGDSMDDAIQARRELNNLEPVYAPRFFCDDVSVEALTSLIARHGRIAHISAEGGLVDTLAGRYSNSPNLDAVLKAWGGERILVDRKGRAPERIDNPALTIGLCIQPDVLRSLMSNHVFKGRGLNGRFLYCIPKSKRGTRPLIGTPIDPIIKTKYEAMCLQVVSYPVTELTLSPDALDVLERYHWPIEKQLVNLEFMGSWAEKMEGQVQRICGILHVMGGESGTEISGKTAEAACAIGDYLTEHAKAAFDHGGDDALAPARHLWDKICEMASEGTVNKRLLHQACRGTYPTIDDLDGPLEVLEGLGYVRQVESSGRGRHSVTIEINPLITEGLV